MTAAAVASPGDPNKKLEFKPREIVPLFKGAFAEWEADRAGRLAAALAYFTLFAIAPLLIVVIWAIGLLGHQLGIHHGQVRDQIIGQLGGAIGSGGADAVKMMVESAYKPKQGLLASIFSMVLFIFAASGMFGALQDALNSIWHVPMKHATFLQTLETRFRSIGMIFVLAFLLLVAIAASSILAGATTWLSINVAQLAPLGKVASFLLSFALMTALFALLFKVLPDVRIAWSDVWIGASVTALLFVIGEFVLGIYFARTSVGSTYGAAGSLVVFILWVYYAAQILFFGAEFTKVYANTFGSHVGSENEMSPAVP